MIGFALLMLFSLWWMRSRVQRRGALSPVGGSLMRSLYPIVMGFGGWFLALLIVMTIWPSYFIGSMLLAVLSIGIPIGVGVYWAWVHRDWPAARRQTGFWAALAGGLVGAWVGFIAVVGLLALFTAIIGAAVGANLALIVLDVRRRAPQDSPLVPADRELVEAR